MGMKTLLLILLAVALLAACSPQPTIKPVEGDTMEVTDDTMMDDHSGAMEATDDAMMEDDSMMDDTGDAMMDDSDTMMADGFTVGDCITSSGSLVYQIMGTTSGGYTVDIYSSGTRISQGEDVSAGVVEDWITVACP